MAVDGVTISLLLNWYKETSFLDLMFDSIADLVDEVIVVCGPYRYMDGTLQIFDKPLLGTEAELVFQKYVKCSNIKFIHGPWNSEDEKRIEGYSQCKGDIVLSIDADEIVDIDRNALIEFINSPFSLAQIGVINVLTPKFLYGSDLYDQISAFPMKSLFFKRNHISSREHLNYLWLVGVKQDLESRLPPFPHSIGLMFHATGLRNMEDQFTRIIFYQSLWNKTSTAGNLDNFELRLKDFASHKAGYLATTTTGMGLDSDKYSPIPNASWLNNHWWKLVIKRGSEHVFGRWNTKFEYSSLPEGSAYFLSFEQLSESLNNGDLNRSNILSQSMLVINNDGQKKSMQFDSDLFDNYDSMDIAHGFVQLSSEIVSHLR